MKESNYEYWKEYHSNDVQLYLSEDVDKNPECRRKVAFELVDLFNSLRNDNPVKVGVKRNRPFVARIKKFFIRVRENNIIKIIDGEEFIEDKQEEYTIMALLEDGKECIFGTIGGKYIMYGRIAVWFNEEENAVFFGMSELYDANWWILNYEKRKN